MTPRTRKRLFVCLIVAALTLPAEIVLLQAIAQPDAQAAANDWSASLSDAQVVAAAGQLSRMPFRYRKAVMGKLNPAGRSAAWRAHIGSYRLAHPELSAEQTQVLLEAEDLVSPAFFGAGITHGAESRQIGERAVALFGRDLADYLFYRLGPKDEVVIAHALPLNNRLVDWARSTFVVNAFLPDCDCSTNWGCDWGGETHCSDNSACDVDDEWPSCGWFWDDDCDGRCRVGLPQY